MTDALDTLIDRLREERDQALAQAAQAEQGREAAQRQAEQLQHHRLDCLQRFGAQAGAQLGVERLRHLHHFVGRLDQALAQQARAVEQAQRRAERARELRRALELRLASAEALRERRQAEQAARAGRREQKQLDEFASRQAWQRLQDPEARGIGA